MQLSWGLLVATFQRHEILKECVTRALEQTRRPSEIVIIDASENWEASRDAIWKLANESGLNVRLVYERAVEASTSCQRNQALAMSSVDVAFMFDDDTLMWPDCAEQILLVYELDAGARVLAVGAGTVDQRWAPSTTDDRGNGSLQGKRCAPLQWLEHRLTSGGFNFLAYDKLELKPLPDELRGLNVAVENLISGYRLTIRRSIFPEFQFCERLKRYASGEDLDLTYRLGRKGVLINAFDAKVFHEKSPSGRLSRQVSTSLRCLNMMYLFRKNCHPARSGLVPFRFFAGRLLIELLSDVSRRRLTMPQFRGVLRVIPQLRSIWRLQGGALDARYTEITDELLGRRVPMSAATEFAPSARIGASK